MVVRADFHAAEAAEKALCLIGADTLVLERNRVVHPARIPTSVKGIPARAFVGMDRGECADTITNDRAGIALIGDHEREGPAFALTHHDNALALAGAVRLQAAILAILFPVLRLHVAAKVAAIDLNRAVQGESGLLGSHRLAQLVRENEGGFVLAIEVAAELESGNALSSPVTESPFRDAWGRRGQA